MNKFSKAVVRRPCPQLIYGLTNSKLGKPDYYTALKQHDQYIDALQKLESKDSVSVPQG